MPSDRTAYYSFAVTPFTSSLFSKGLAVLQCAHLLLGYLLSYGSAAASLVVCMWVGMSVFLLLDSSWVENLSQSSSTAWLPQEIKQPFTCLIPVVIGGSCCVGYMLLQPLQLVAKTPTWSSSSHHRPRVSAICFDFCCWPSVLSSHAGLTSSWHLVLAAHTLAQDGISKEASADQTWWGLSQSNMLTGPILCATASFYNPLFVSHLALPQPPSPSHAFICWCNSTHPLPTPWVLRFACLSVAKSWFAPSYLIALHSLFQPVCFLFLSLRVYLQVCVSQYFAYSFHFFFIITFDKDFHQIILLKEALPHSLYPYQ